MIIALRKPCVCGCSDGTAEYKNGQDVVRCSGCNKFQYNAPKDESGKGLRKIIKDSVKNQVFQRDGFRCMICGASAAEEAGVILNLSHIISVCDAEKISEAYGVKCDEWVNKPINLFTCCEACNHSTGSMSLIPKVAVFISETIRRRPTNA